MGLDLDESIRYKDQQLERLRHARHEDGHFFQIKYMLPGIIIIMMVLNTGLWILEQLSPLSWADQIDSSTTTSSTHSLSKLLPPNDPEWQLWTVQSGDSLSRLFKRHGLPAADLVKVMDASDKHRSLLTKLKPHDVLYIKRDGENQLVGLYIDQDKDHSLWIENHAGDFQANFLALENEVHRAAASGVVDKTTPATIAAPDPHVEKPQKTAEFPEARVGATQAPLVPEYTEVSLTPKKSARSRPKLLPPNDPGWQLWTVRSGDSLSRLFKRHGLPAADLVKVMDASDKHRSLLTKLKPHDVLYIKRDKENQLVGLYIDQDKDHSLWIENHAGDFQANFLVHENEVHRAAASGVVDQSLYVAARKEGLSNELIAQLEYIFAWDVDFSHELRSGDHFSVIYEQIYRNGKWFDHGNILAAQLQARGKEFRAVRFEYGNHQGYYTPEGKNMHRSFTRKPVKYHRISGTFGPRMHPILHRMRQHNGVDFAAPMGTPVKATSDGIVTTKAYHRGGYGRVIKLQHGDRYTTVYAHLSKFAHSLKRNDRVKQGQIIGYVGSTGLSTGPHLHYEFRVDGAPHDPLTVQLPRGSSIPVKYRADFKQQSGYLMASIDAYTQTRFAALEKNSHIDRGS